MAEDDNILFVRGVPLESSGIDENVWDDSALIKAYDKAVNAAKYEVGKRLGVDKQTENRSHKKSSSSNQENQSHGPKRHSKKSQKKWSVGSPCRAIYSEDGVDYEAVIIKINEPSGTCVVKFVGYDNSEEIALSKLTETKGLNSQMEQCKQARLEEINETTTLPDNASASHKANGTSEERMDCETHDSKFHDSYAPGMSFNPAFSSMPPAPPLPPQLMAKLPETDADALSSMLMSWYISGFHTGYYHGIRKGRCQQEKQKK